jgi:non-ribosomal peptide synthetase component F
LIFETEELSYRQLNEQSNQLAHYLKSRGVKAGMMVPIAMKRGIKMMVGILAILKAGAVYVPVDPEYPEERIRFMLEDINAKIILATSETRQLVPENYQLDIIEADSEWDKISEASYRKSFINNRTRFTCLCNLHFWFYRGYQRE